MPRVHSRRRFYDGLSLSPELYDEALRPYQEIRGRLGQHNFNASVLVANTTRRDDYDVGAHGQKASTRTNVTDDLLARAYNRRTDGATTALTGTGLWLPLPNTLLDVNTVAGRAKVVLHAQGVLNTYFYSSDEIAPIYVKFGILVDGGLVSEAIIGGLDDGWEPSDMENGVGYLYTRETLSFNIPMAAGRHTLQGAIWMESVDLPPFNRTDVGAAFFAHHCSLDMGLKAR